MGEAAVQMERDESRGGAEEARSSRALARVRLRTCVGCGDQVDTLAEGDLIRLILGPEGQIAVDPRGGGFGRGAHVHARRDCVERAAKAGLLKATKGKAHLASDDGGEGANALTGEALAGAITSSLDRRIEGLIATVVRSRRIAFGSEAVMGACRRGEAELVVVACDAAAAADLTDVRRAVSEGRAVAWGTKRRLGALVHRNMDDGGAGVGVIAIASRTVGAAIGSAVRAANAVAAAPSPKRPKSGATQQGGGIAPKPPLEAD